MCLDSPLTGMNVSRKKGRELSRVLNARQPVYRPQLKLLSHAVDFKYDGRFLHEGILTGARLRNHHCRREARALGITTRIVLTTRQLISNRYAALAIRHSACLSDVFQECHMLFILHQDRTVSRKSHTRWIWANRRPLTITSDHGTAGLNTRDAGRVPGTLTPVEVVGVEGWNQSGNLF